MGAFPNLSRNVPFCPRLSSLSRFVPVPGPKKDKRGQTGTNGTFRGRFRSLRHDNKTSRQYNFHLQNFIVVAFPTENSVLDNFPLCPPAHPPPPEKRKFYFYCRFAFSEDWKTPPCRIYPYLALLNSFNHSKNLPFWKPFVLMHLWVPLSHLRLNHLSRLYMSQLLSHLTCCRVRETTRRG